jgi:hypothetical protein
VLLLERIAGHETALRKAIAAADAATGALMTESIEVQVQDPKGLPIGVASVSEVDAPGMTVLAGIYGVPFLVAYPNGWRVLQFAPGIIVPARSNLPYQSSANKAPSFGWENGAMVLGIAGLAATIFFGTLSVKPGRDHARRTWKAR